jgi:hypothetical protein
MRACACLWGGVFNPIIPVFRRAPDEWRPEIYQRFKGAEVARGYVRFFEPDVYIEAEGGLLEEVGLGALRQQHALHAQVIPLGDLLKPQENRDWSEPALGLNIRDVLAHIYKTELQFVRRDNQQNLHVSPQPGTALTEAMFGVYPTYQHAKYIEQGYKEVYNPER